MLFFPAHLGVAYEYPVFRSFFHPQVMLSFMFLAALFGLGVYMTIGRGTDNGIKTKGKEDDSRSFRLIGFGILWFFITLSVESIITLPRVFETYRVYLPSVGVIISTVTELFLLTEKMRSPKARETIVVMIVIIIGVLSVATYHQNEVYKNELRSWEDTAKEFPTQARVHYNLGVAYQSNNMTDKAIEQYAIAIKLKPDYAEAYNNLGLVYYKLNMTGKAIEQYAIAIKLKPDFAEAYNNLGLVYNKLNMTDKAIEQYAIAIKLKPDYASPHNNLGLVYYKLNMTDKAMNEFQTVISLDPNIAQAHFNLGYIYFKTGRTEDARNELLSSLKIKPDYQEAQQLLEKVSR